jgi:hypothetical protein
METPLNNPKEMTVWVSIGFGSKKCSREEGDHQVSARQRRRCIVSVRQKKYSEISDASTKTIIEISLVTATGKV